MTLNVVGMFCEDIREERSGQVSLVGVLPDNINIAPPPLDKPTARITVPKLGVYVRIHLGVEDDQSPMSLKLIFPDGGEIELGVINEPLIEKSKREARNKQLPIAGIISQAVLMGLLLPGPGIITAVLDDGIERHICAVLNAQIAPEASLGSNASPLPASQSQPASQQK